jgi:glucokinase
MILAGDVGGTKTNLGLFTSAGHGPLHLSTYPSNSAVLGAARRATLTLAGNGGCS